MKKQFLFPALLLIFVISAVAIGYMGAAQNRTAASLAGIWKGNFPGAPAVELTLKIEAGKLAGKAIFYKVVISGAGAEIKGKDEAPLTNPVFDGRTLSFKIKRPDGTFFKGKVQFVADDEAVIRPDEPNARDDEAMILRREK
ncbi:MAG: hypothetical protein ACREEM_52720 [Blastocatellia bacterium]